MISHLWHAHKLTLEHGKIRAWDRLIADPQNKRHETDNLELLDRAVALDGLSGLRRWLAHSETPAKELTPLLNQAAEQGAGLCPNCFSHLPAAVQPLPPPLQLADGRLAGEGFAVAMEANRWIQNLTVTFPEREMTIGRHSLTPRGAGTLVAALLLLVVLLCAPSQTFASIGGVLALGAYLVVRFTQTAHDTSEDRLIDIAWLRIAPRQAGKERATRFLIRLCRASLGRGNSVNRAELLYRLADHAREKAAESDLQLQLLAAVSVLQVEDEAKYGRDGVAGIAELAAKGLSGTLPTDYAEYVVESYFSRPRDAGETGRLRILLLAAAFEAGLVPCDLLELWRGAPCLKQAMMMEPVHRLGLLFGLWRSRDEQAWRSVGDAMSVFELARTSPPTAIRILAQFPDLLLVHHLEEEIEALVGPVLVCSRGVAVGGLLTADPEAKVRLVGDGSELVFGQHRLELAGELPLEFLALIRQWLRFRTEMMLPFIEGYRSPGSADISARVLRPFCRCCLSCGTVSVVSVGAIAQRVPN
jgi:hypothetical protein